ncbi:hypothetical protein P3T36_004709 [Kitasatospora sp. MAP12-15]|uniref:peptidase M23 n=1 Tax=unclassified Kitasatospora TaxID=2633591 RepID=UPI002475689B|nr:peptidase M23 [Kitasatospora sp. MAP12-44]MDH6110358.1 hypothetical protein [Kitasatospora sp. MAP12-44]
MRRLLTVLATATLLAAGLLAAPAAQAASAAPASPASPALSYKTVYVFQTGAHIRACPTTSCTIVDTVSHIYLDDWCQTDVGTTPVVDPGAPGGKNPWWSEVTLTSGSDSAWISNTNLQGGIKIAGVPDCAS